MYFKALEMQGFKSFADKIRLEFTPGVTAIVGPNGSGKSNISDAMRWVMGEMSAKTLRGAKMEDVIFAGTQKRSPLGFAEVTIIIDNSDRTLDIDFSEVSITRKVYRSGESEYYINKAQCRLKDIHELLMDTGLGRDGYSIVGQGRIDEIVSAKSEERRSVFDEAAGITKYRYRKEEAERKLSAAEDNLSRINDIISEIEVRLEPLEIQAEKAKKYLVLRDELKTLEVNVWLENVDKFKEQLGEIEQTFKGTEERLTNAKENAVKSEQDLHSLREEARNKDSEVDSFKATMFSAKNSVTRLEGEITLLESRIADTQSNSHRLKAEKEVAIDRSAEIAKEIEEKSAECVVLEEDLNKARVELEGILNKEAEIIKSIEAKRSLNRSNYDELARKRQDLAGLQAKKEATGQYAFNLRQRVDELTVLLNQSQERLKDARCKADEARKLFDEAKKQASEVGSGDNENVKALESEFAQLKRNLDAIKNRIEANKNKKHILEELENEFEGYHKSVKAVMNEYRYGSLKGRGIYGPLSRMFSVDSKYIIAIEAVLGAAMQNIVTETEDDAKAAIEFLKAGARGRATFLPVSSVKGRVLEERGISGCKGFLGMGYELAEYDAKFDGIIKSLLGRTAIVDIMDNAVAMAKRFSYSFRIVTLQGEVLNAGGSITGGSMNNQSGAFSRAGELAQLESDTANLEKQAKEKAKVLEKLNGEVESERLRVEKNRSEYMELQSRLYKLKSEFDTAFAALNSIENGEKKAKSELDLVVVQREQAEGAFEEIGRVIADLQMSIGEAECVSAEDNKGYEGLEASLEDVRKEIMERRIRLTSIEKDIEVAKEAFSRLDGEVVLFGQRIELADLQMQDLARQGEEMAKEIEQKRYEMVELKENTVNHEGLIENVIKEKNELQATIERVEGQYKLLNEEIFALQGEFGRIEAKKAKLEVELDGLITRLWEEYELTYSTAIALKTDVGGAVKAQKRINELKANVKALGSINIDAIEEFKSVSERYNFLTEQRDDLTEAKENLIKLIFDMTEIMQQQFKENFELLNKKFGETFVQLFGGGKGSLRLSNPEDVLKSGIDIEVQPPGKKLQSITLLSGGEKAFTAIALLFAILKVRPVFFCIFDEIEAALDDENVFKFADYVKAYSDKTQFILITHRKGTMEAANTLYGVTMQEKGVSKLLALELDNITA